MTSTIYTYTTSIIHTYTHTHTHLWTASPWQSTQSLYVFQLHDCTFSLSHTITHSSTPIKHTPDQPTLQVWCLLLHTQTHSLSQHYPLSITHSQSGNTQTGNNQSFLQPPLPLSRFRFLRTITIELSKNKTKFTGGQISPVIHMCKDVKELKCTQTFSQIISLN